MSRLEILGLSGQPVGTIGFWDNIAGGWVVRGGLGLNIPLNGSGSDALISQLAIGQTLTAHDVPLFGDFTYYSTVVDTSVSNGGPTSATLPPASALTWATTGISSPGCKRR